MVGGHDGCPGGGLCVVATDRYVEHSLPWAHLMDGNRL